MAGTIADCRSGLGFMWAIQGVQMSSSTYFIYPNIANVARALTPAAGCPALQLRPVEEESAQIQEPVDEAQEYRIKVTTGDKLRAGTNADISIVLIGSQGRSDELLLDQKGRNNFERGQVGHTARWLGAGCVYCALA